MREEMMTHPLSTAILHALISTAILHALISLLPVGHPQAVEVAYAAADKTITLTVRDTPPPTAAVQHSPCSTDGLSSITGGPAHLGWSLS